MNICLIFPNYKIRERFGDPTDPPLGIALIAAVLENQGYGVNIIDANAENLNISEIRDRLLKIKPDIVAISCNYSPLHNPTLNIAAMVKNQFNIPVVVGGNHATALAEYLISCSDDIDYIARGEGETVLPDLLEALQRRKDFNDVKGLTYKSGKTIISNEDATLIADLDKIPLPAYHLLPMEKYRRYNIIASRGCPFNCNYCASNVIFKRKARYRSPKRIVDEIELLYTNYGAKQFWFSDDTFTSNTQYLNSLLNEMRERNINIDWNCLTRVNSISKDLLENMKNAGCTYISYGVESGNQKMLSHMNKKISINDVENALNLTREVGIRMYLFFLAGYLDDTWNCIKDGYKLIIKTKPDGVSFAVVVPLPGTKMFDDLVSKNIINCSNIQWDYLFAKVPGNNYENYAAELASKWCNLDSDGLIKACEIGETLPLIIKYCDIPLNLDKNDVAGILELFTPDISSNVRSKNIFIDSVQMYIDLMNNEKSSLLI